jgi:hypothetical protein
MPAAVVGQLKVLMSADSAQIVSDLGKARAAVRETSGEIGSRARDAVRFLTDQVKGVGPALKGVQQATQITVQSFAALGTKVPPQIAGIGNAIAGLAAGGFTPLGIALAAVTAGFALLASQKEETVSAFAATEERAKTLRENLEKLRVELGLVRSGKPSTGADVDIAGAEQELQRRRNVAAREKEAGFLGSEGVTAFWRNLGGAVFPEEGFLPSIDTAEQAARRAVKEQEDFIRTLKEQQGVQTEIEKRRKTTADTAKREADEQKKITDQTKAAVDALAKFETADTTRARALRDKGVDIETMLHPELFDAGIEKQKSRVHDAIADLMKVAHGPPDERRELEARVFFEREMLDLLLREKEVRRDTAATQGATAKADAMRRENDLSALRASTDLTDRQKALAEAKVEFDEGLRQQEKDGLKADSAERLRLVEEFRRKEAAINAEFDERESDARRTLLDRVDAVRRAAQAAAVGADRNETTLRLEEVDRRHAEELRRVDEGLRHGTVTEDQAAQARATLAAAHADLRQAVVRDALDKELAWRADFNQRLLALQTEGETDGLRLIQLGTEQRLAALQEETRRIVEELRRRGETVRAQQIADASAQTEARIRRQGELSAAVAGDDAGAGFQARISQLREETAGWGRLGAQMADVAVNDLSGGIAAALQDIARGTKTASQAFKDFAADFAFQVARMIEQALIMKAILALFPGLGAAGGAAGAGAGAVAASAAPAATGAHGGTWRVGGFGGLDSQLVTMKLSPGELVRVSNGANSGGAGGDVQVALTVRPPAVIADEVLARSSPAARAAIVSSAIRRSGRRGMRAKD